MYVNSSSQLFPLLRIAIALILGIVIGDEFSCTIHDSVWLSLMVGMLVCALLTKKYLPVHTLGIYLYFIFFGALLISHQEDAQKVEWGTCPILAQGVVVNAPVMKAKVVEWDVRMADSHSLIKAFVVRDKRSEALDVGDGISFCSVVRKPENRGHSTFDYAAYLRNHGFSGTTFVESGYWSAAAVDISSLSLLERAKLKMMRLRTSLLRRYSLLGISGQTYAVTAALTLGDKSSLDKQTKDAYSRAGASHILALSGLHLGILYSILTLLLGRTKRSLSTPLILLAVWTFVLVVGMSPSVVRAAAMLSIHAFVSLLNRDKTSVNTLAMAALLMLTVNAQSLFDVGFQLSFLAVLSILMFYPPLYHSFQPEWMMNHPVFSFVLQMLVVSVSAQLGTFPLVMYYFGNIPVYFLLTNCVVIPLATVVLYLSAALFVLVFIPAIQQLLAFLLMTVVSWMNMMMDVINRLPSASISHLSPSALQVIMIYLTLFSFYLLLLRPSPRRMKFSLTTVLVTLVSFLPIG